MYAHFLKERLIYVLRLNVLKYLRNSASNVITTFLIIIDGIVNVILFSIRINQPEAKNSVIFYKLLATLAGKKKFNNSE